jgi:hypothetical protein
MYRRIDLALHRIDAWRGCIVVPVLCGWRAVARVVAQVGGAGGCHTTGLHMARGL